MPRSVRRAAHSVLAKPGSSCRERNHRLCRLDCSPNTGIAPTPVPKSPQVIHHKQCCFSSVSFRSIHCYPFLSRPWQLKPQFLACTNVPSCYYPYSHFNLICAVQSQRILHKWTCEQYGRLETVERSSCVELRALDKYAWLVRQQVMNKGVPEGLDIEPVGSGTWLWSLRIWVFMATGTRKQYSKAGPTRDRQEEETGTSRIKLRPRGTSL